MANPRFYSNKTHAGLWLRWDWEQGLLHESTLPKLPFVSLAATALSQVSRLGQCTCVCVCVCARVRAHVRASGERKSTQPTTCYITTQPQQLQSTEESFPAGDRRPNSAMIIWWDPGSRTLGFFLEMVLFLLITFLVGGVGRKGNSLQSAFKWMFVPVYDTTLSASSGEPLSCYYIWFDCQ